MPLYTIIVSYIAILAKWNMEELVDLQCRSNASLLHTLIQSEWWSIFKVQGVLLCVWEMPSTNKTVQAYQQNGVYSNHKGVLL